MARVRSSAIRHPPVRPMRYRPSSSRTTRSTGVSTPRVTPSRRVRHLVRPPLAHNTPPSAERPAPSAQGVLVFLILYFLSHARSPPATLFRSRRHHRELHRRCSGPAPHRRKYGAWLLAL